jgi:single-strand DNA-binding protein
MSTSINQVTLMGNVGRAPAWGTLPGGAPFCQIALATDDIDHDWRTGQSVRVTNWHRVVLTGSTAASIRGALDKGDRLHVEGRIQTRKWTDRAGAVRYTTEVVAARVQVYQRPGSAASGAAADKGIADWLAAYDTETARLRVLPPTTNYGRQGRRMSTCGETQGDAAGGLPAKTLEAKAGRPPACPPTSGASTSNATTGVGRPQRFCPPGRLCAHDGSGQASPAGV